METAEILSAFLKAFAVGGLICAVAQLVINFTDLTAGKILVIFMLAGVALTALGAYQPLVEWAGAGATVPISGFGYLLANGAMRGAERGLFHPGQRRRGGRFGGRGVFVFGGARVSLSHQVQLKGAPRRPERAADRTGNGGICASRSLFLLCFCVGCDTIEIPRRKRQICLLPLRDTAKRHGPVCGGGMRAFFAGYGGRYAQSVRT